MNSSLIKQKNLNGTRNLTQQDIQTPSLFVDEEVHEKKSTTTQQRIFPVQPTLTTPRNRNTALPQTSMQSTVKPYVSSKYSQMDYQTFRAVRTSKQTYKQKTSQRKIFSNQSYKFFANSKTTKTLNMNCLNYSQSKNQNVPQQTSQSVSSVLMINHELR